WHGAAWTFVLWGAWQGLFLIVERLLGKRAPYGFLPGPLQVVVTFAIVLFGWALFRAEDTARLSAVVGGMVGASGAGEVPAAAAHAVEAWLGLGIGVGLAFAAPHSWAVAQRFAWRDLIAIGPLFVVAVAQLAARSHTPFIYFQF